MNGMRYQPQGVARLDRGNPFAKALAFVATAGQAVDRVSGRLATSNATSVMGCPVGLGFGCTGSGQQVVFDHAPLLTSNGIGTGDYSIFFYSDAAPNDPVACIYGQKNDGLGAPYTQVGVYSNSNLNEVATPGALALIQYSGSNNHAIAENAFDGKLHFFIATRVNGIFRIYRDGADITSSTSGASSQAVWRSGLKTGIGNIGGSGTSRPYARVIPLAGSMNDGLTPAAAAQFSTNPWQIFEDPSGDDYFPSAALSYTLAVQPAAMSITAGQVGMRVSRQLRAEPASLVIASGSVGMRASRKLAVAPAAMTLATSDVALLASRRLGVGSAAMAVAGGQVALRVSRRLSVAPAAMVMTGGQVSMLYAPNPEPGSYTLPVSAAAMTLTGGNVGMRITRRLRVEPASLVLAGGAVRALVSRRLLVSPAGLQLVGGQVTLRFSARGDPFDITKIHPSRLVIFEGSGSRITPFEGSGSRITPFEGSGSRITRFE